MEEPFRVRVVFDDRKILTRSQRSEGLKHCWLLLKPGIATISDLASLVRTSFHLNSSCPNGLVLSIDDFVLPPFESTCVLKDKDIIRVRKKDAGRMDVIELGDDPCYIQDSKVLEKQHNSSNKILAIRKFGEDSGCKKKNDRDLCAHNENAIQTETPSKSKKKRKHTEEVSGSKNKKLKTSSKKRTITGDEEEDTAEEDDDIHLGKSLESSQKRVGSRKSSNKKDKPSTIDGRPATSQLEDNVEQVISSDQREKRNVQVEENIVGNTCEPHVNGSVTKVPSRNARRKKAKRQWLREIKSQKGLNTQSQTSPNVIHRESSGLREAEQNTELEKEIVPVVIRPGHIRFQPLDEEQSQWKPQETKETLQWNGITSKKKGQKWVREKMVGNWNNANGYKEQSNGKEKTVSKWTDANGCKGQKWAREKTMSKWNDANGCKGQKWAREKTASKWNDVNDYKEQSNRKDKTVSKWNYANGYTKQCNAKASKWNDASGYNEQSNRNTLSEKGKTGSGHIDFESLFPLTRIPQVGDVLAYRLIELSSSWCPEISSFQVGQVTSYNYLSMSIILVPVPEYPIFSDEDIERRDPMLQENSSPYNEDGSLQIHYPSLVDVRLLKASESEATPSDYSGRELSNQQVAPVNNWELAVAKSNADSGREMSAQERVNNWELAAVTSNAQVTVAQPTENGNAGGSTWNQIKEALNKKKAELQEKDGWDEWTPNKSTASTSWSYRALRRSAVGPTLAYIRGKNDKRPYGK